MKWKDIGQVAPHHLSLRRTLKLRVAALREELAKSEAEEKRILVEAQSYCHEQNVIQGQINQAEVLLLRLEEYLHEIEG